MWTITHSAGIRRPGWSIVNVRPIIEDQNSPCIATDKILANIRVGALFKQTVAALGELIYRKMKGFGLEDSYVPHENSKTPNSLEVSSSRILLHQTSPPSMDWSFKSLHRKNTFWKRTVVACSFISCYIPASQNPHNKYLPQPTWRLIPSSSFFFLACSHNDTSTRCDIPTLPWWHMLIINLIGSYSNSQYKKSQCVLISSAFALTGQLVSDSHNRRCGCERFWSCYNFPRLLFRDFFCFLRSIFFRSSRSLLAPFASGLSIATE